MYFHHQEAIKALVLLLFSGFIFMLHHTGEIIKFINPQYTALSQIASIIFLFLFFIQVPRMFITKEQAKDHDYCTILGCNHEIVGRQLSIKKIAILFIIILPLLTGFFLPYKDLGAEEAVKRGICYTPTSTHNDNSVTISSSNKTLQQMLNSQELILDERNFATYVDTIRSYPKQFHGKSISLEGFILVDEKVSHDHPLIGRFLVTHCVADAHVTGLLLESDQGTLRDVRDWVTVRGEISSVEKNGQILPIILVEDWTKIMQPEAPYIYP
ncbi:TIGR03943 family putative permease subunit [Evansella cellulosilytica]|uniref:TIGR03943 family protein n=1 Tax=Evansella cellulosilytica (strain ATCC 21833 / DSM 2522 / FERM P-1141 / JCM 9156 / N-4) TaxID=649639 RepID=E6U0R4_EVAC2|nr:TIGR03943 family protein [Evansella cellulosilytica]ADU29112.1 protein of unknown function DUF1980 [Evansella cellulosilytica DSM 2522]